MKRNDQSKALEKSSKAMVKVMVFGTFDMLHPGHLYFLKESKKHGDYLIVVLARDGTVDKVKHKRPVHDENQRMDALEKTGIADKVLLGDMPASYRHIIEEKPDIICLGYDQDPRDVEKTFPKIKFVRMHPYHPERFKTTKIVENHKRGDIIRTIIFDLNDVLVTYSSKNSDPSYIKHLGMARKDFWSARMSFNRDYFLGKIGLDEFLSDILKHHGISQEKLPMLKELHRKDLSLVDGITDLLDEIKAHDYEMMLLAGDGEESLDLKLDNFSLRGYFDKIYCTCYEGFVKSDPRLYDAVIRKAHLNPAHCVFIDDIQSHVDLARKAGMNAILFENTKKLRLQLKRLGIKIQA